MKATEALVRFEPLGSLPAVPDRYRGQHRTLIDFARAATLAKWRHIGFGIWCGVATVASAAIMIGCLLHGGWFFSLAALPFLLVAAVGAYCGFGSVRVTARVAADYRSQAAKLASRAADEEEAAGVVDAWNAAASTWWEGMALPAMSVPRVRAKYLRLVVAKRAALAAGRARIVDAVARLPGRPSSRSLSAPRP